MILAISGKKGSGKSTLARRIVSAANEAGGDASRFSLAEPIKDMAVELLGLPESQVYGDDAAKESPTPYLWEAFPVAEAIRGRRGPMTVRDILQNYATVVFRAQDPDVFVRSCLGRIAAYLAMWPAGPAVIDDMRFLGEAIALRAAGAKLVRLTRGRGGDSHRSETELDDYGRFDLVLDNRGLTADETWAEIQPFLHAEGIIQ